MVLTEDEARRLQRADHWRRPAGGAAGPATRHRIAVGHRPVRHLDPTGGRVRGRRRLCQG